MYIYDASSLDMAIDIANRYKSKIDSRENDEFIRGLEAARSLLRTKEDDDKLMEDYFGGKLETQ